MSRITPEDTLLITYHNKEDFKVASQSVKTSLAEAISLGNLAIRNDPRIESFRVMDVVYNSKYKG